MKSALNYSVGGSELTLIINEKNAERMNKYIPVKFQNKRSTMSVWVNKFITTLIFTLLIILTGFTKWFNEPFLGIERLYWLIIIVLLWLCIIALQNFRKPCYIYFEDTKDSLILRYYPLRIINQKKIAIEVPKKDLLQYKTEKFFFGKYEKLIIFQRFKKGVAKYPPISLSAVNKNDIAKIKTLLSQYVKQQS